MKKPPREERFRAREWERQARAAQMSSSAVDHDGPAQSPLFKEPIKVYPSSTDRVSHAIHSTLGDFSYMRDYLNKDSSGLIGVDGVPPSPGPAHPVHQSPPLNGNTAARLQASPDNRYEFKKPHQQMHPPPQGHQRGGYVKPAEGKPPYLGRGGYPGQPVKRGAGGAPGHRANGLVPAKGPPSLNPSGPRHPYEMNQPPLAAPREPLPSATPGPQDVDNILKEMIFPTAAISAIAATPRIDSDNKYQYNPLVKVPEPVTPVLKKRERPTTSRIPSTDIHSQLELSEDSDDDDKKHHVLPSRNLALDKMLSPIHQTPAPHQSRHSERVPSFSSGDQQVPPQPRTPPSSSSDSGSDSAESDSESSSEDSAEERVTSQSQAGPASSTVQPPPPPRPEPPGPAPQSPHGNDEQENRTTRWNLASFVNSQNETASPTKTGAVQRVSPDSRKRPADCGSDSDERSSDSAQLDRTVAEAQQLVALVKGPITSLSDSDDQRTEQIRQRHKRQRPYVRPPSSRSRLSESEDSDSDRPQERSCPAKVAPKPVVRPSPRTKSVGSQSDSDSDIPFATSAKSGSSLTPKTLPLPTRVDLVESDSDVRTPIQSTSGSKSTPSGESSLSAPKPKGRGRPRKIKTEGGEGDSVRKRGRPPRVSRDGEVKKTGRRGRPPKIRSSPPPSSSDEEGFEKPSAPLRKTKAKKNNTSSDSDSSRPSYRRRKSSYQQDSDRDSVQFNHSPSKKKSKAARGSDEFKNAKHDSDDEWNERKRSRVKALFQDSRSDRSESESSVRRRRDKPKESTSPFRRKHAKSVAFVQTSDSSDSDEPPPRVGRPSRSSTSENHVHHISDSDSDLDSVPKNWIKWTSTSRSLTRTKTTCCRNCSRRNVIPKEVEKVAARVVKVEKEKVG
ncbi:AF4/FMR2 family member 4-like isoform X2 [Sitophilus oryzae]|uniref:AF4/FMR2 family member 4-like isoform X2 n=1 Tax=Sitophilus oryzae TaxID=7048 RepID=A0A6J2YV44_SITOR|nr:AF4/FMR2 family member 4-like isoform X2 [Sitophilus oryzae]